MNWTPNATHARMRYFFFFFFNYFTYFTYSTHPS